MSEIQLPEAFLKLGEVLEQGQFELLFTEEKLRLVYLMNDAVESFLVFENARMTGQYREDYEGELEAELSVTEEPEESYVLVVHQGETVVTIFFEDLSEEVHLYDYGEIGHFWVKGAEYLRQIEYKIAIVRDKLDYLGAKYCNQTEAETSCAGGLSAAESLLLSGSFRAICSSKGKSVGTVSRSTSSDAGACGNSRR